jgi:hypothetical protein
LAATNNAAINILAHMSLQISTFSLWGRFLRVGFEGQGEYVFLILIGIARLLSIKRLSCFTTQPAMDGNTFYSTFLLATGIIIS